MTPANCESVPERAAAAGFKWLALNVVDQDASKWDLVRSRAKARGLVVYPWGRLHTAEALDVICEVARRQWMTRPLLNIEDEAKPPGLHGSRPWGQPKAVRARIASRWPKSQPILSIPGWPYWGGTDWTPLADYPALLQILWEDMGLGRDEVEIARVQADCEFMAKKVFKRVGVSYQTYRGTSSALYDLDRAGVSLIWGDTTNDFKSWARP